MELDAFYVIGIWQSNIERSCVADFDLYGAEVQEPVSAKVEIYLSW